MSDTVEPVKTENVEEVAPREGDVGEGNVEKKIIPKRSLYSTIVSGAQYVYPTTLIKDARLTAKIIYDKENKDRIHKIRIDKLEADDIIAVICKHYEKKYPEEKVYLISGDKDFLQLGRENLIFINYKSKKPFTLTLEEAKEQLKLKILNGDCSDNILTIFPKDKKILSLKKRKELIENEDKLNEYLDENPEIKEKYKINCKMIDFNFIPKELQKEILKELKNL